MLRNPLIAQAFYFAGIIERWGTGTTRMVRLCQEQGLPQPEFQNWQGGVRVVFSKDPYTPERLRMLGLSERQIQAVLYVKERGSITNRNYRQLTGLSDEGARLDLKALVEMGIFVMQGKGRGAVYVVRKLGDFGVGLAKGVERYRGCRMTMVLHTTPYSVPTTVPYPSRRTG
ncbi:MAG: hypothetical protein KatS3mg023_1783 [Armatimonadota bacterium]|nr:MAG: hypothetical protein KatS3mg023_1783 [Armatimonadota bacterium]